MLRTLFLTLFAVSFESALSAECETPWVKVGSKCMWKSKNLATRAENLRNCRDFGATLVSPRSHKENKLVKKFVGDTPNEYYWLSGQLITRGQPNFVWMDGQSIDYMDWNPGQPHYVNDVTGRGVCMLVDGIYGWHDHPCNGKFMQLCEKKLTSNEKAMKCVKYKEDVKELDKKIKDQETEIKTLKTHLSSHSFNQLVIEQKG